jgi:hypothetical protein
MQPIENERQLIAYIADRNKRGQAARKAGEPEVGIFFVYNGEVLIDSKPLCVTEPYVQFKSADLEYDRYWKFGQRYGVVPREIEYDEVPRGRVEYDINEKKFHVYADHCILKDRKALDDINREFHLPSASTGDPERDPQYRCAGCNGSTKSTKKKTRLPTS